MKFSSSKWLFLTWPFQDDETDEYECLWCDENEVACQQKFTSMSEFVNHINYAHMNDENTDYICMWKGCSRRTPGAKSCAFKGKVYLRSNYFHGFLLFGTFWPIVLYLTKLKTFAKQNTSLLIICACTPEKNHSNAITQIATRHLQELKTWKFTKGPTLGTSLSNASNQVNHILFF